MFKLIAILRQRTDSFHNAIRFTGARRVPVVVVYFNSAHAMQIVATQKLGHLH